MSGTKRGRAERTRTHPEDPWRSTPAELAEEAAWQGRLRRITGLVAAFKSDEPHGSMAERAVARVFDGEWRLTCLNGGPSSTRRAPVLSFDVGCQGTFDFDWVAGYMDCRFSEPARVEFSWQGDVRDDAACGRGWAEVAPDGAMTGRLLIHMGDELRFEARRKAASSKAKAPRAE